VVNKSPESQIREFFTALYRAWGRQRWWPAESALEVVVGAILTQNTAWTNVERALLNLRSVGLLNIDGIRTVPLPELESLIRCAGFFRQKSQRLKTFVAHVDHKYRGSLEDLLSQPTTALRVELLTLNGIGPETADSILLYAGQHEVFVADAYTKRILERHGLISPSASYEEVRQLFERALTPDFADAILSKTEKLEAAVRYRPPGAHHAASPMSTAARSQRAQLLNEMHGLLVGVAKNLCQARRTHCEKCPLGEFLDHSIPVIRPPVRDKTRP
jgi:endonuclease III related protein